MMETELKKHFRLITLILSEKQKRNMQEEEVEKKCNKNQKVEECMEGKEVLQSHHLQQTK